MKSIGKIIRELDELGVVVLNEGPGVLGISVPERAPNGMISEELASYVSEKINLYITDGKFKAGAVQVHHVVRRSENHEQDSPSTGDPSSD